MYRANVIAFVVAAALALAACGPTPPAAPSAPEAASNAATGLQVTDAWASATPNGASVSGGYLTITNPTAEPDALIAVASPRAPRVEIHEMSMDGSVMRMRAVERIEVPAGGSVSLAPGGAHLMFIDVSAPLAVGEDAPVTLTFERAGAMEVTLPVRTRPADTRPAPHEQH